MLEKKFVLEARASQGSVNRSLALKSTPELESLVNSDKNITIVFHNSTSAELFADGLSHSSITISESDLTETYRAPSLQKGFLEFHSTSTKRMTIMSTSDNQELVPARAYVLSKSRREASHLDYSELASKLASTEGLQKERERKRKKTDPNTKEEEKAKTKKQKKAKKTGSASKTSNFVKVSKLSVRASASDLKVFFNGLSINYLFISFTEITKVKKNDDNNYGITSPSSAASSEATVYVEFATAEASRLAVKRHGEALRIRSHSCSSGGTGVGTRTGTGTMENDKDKDKDKDMEKELEISPVSAVEAAWVRGTTIRIHPDSAASIIQEVAHSQELVKWLMREGTPSEEVAGHADNPHKDSDSLLTVASVLGSSPLSLAARTREIYDLVMPPAHTLLFPFLDGPPLVSVQVPGSFGEEEHRILRQSLFITPMALLEPASVSSSSSTLSSGARKKETTFQTQVLQSRRKENLAGALRCQVDNLEEKIALALSSVLSRHGGGDRNEVGRLFSTEEEDEEEKEEGRNKSRDALLDVLTRLHALFSRLLTSVSLNYTVK